jgi:hypothetical protein
MLSKKRVRIPAALWISRFSILSLMSDAFLPCSLTKKSERPCLPRQQRCSAHVAECVVRNLRVSS